LLSLSIALLIALAPGHTVRAAVAVLGTSSSAVENSGTSGTHTISYTVPAGNNRLLVVTSAGGGNNTDISSVTWNGSAMTQAAKLAEGAVSATLNSNAGIWYVLMGSSATSTTANVVVTYGNNFFFVMTATTFSGVDQTTPVSGGTTGRAGSLAVSSASGNMVIDAVAGAPAGATAGGGQTTIGSSSLVFGGQTGGASTAAGGSSVTMSWSGFTSDIVHAGVSINQVSTNSAPVVTTNPTNSTVAAGNTATFTAAASGTPTPTVQWQVSTNGGSSFSTISGATSTTLTLNNVTSGMNGYQYQAVFTNSVTSATSTAATLTVLSPPTLGLAFSPTSIPLTNGSTTLTMTLTNPNTGTTLTGVGFTLNLPSGLQVASTPGVTSSGVGGTFSPTAGATTLTLSGGSIAASGTGTLTVNVTGTSGGTKSATSGAVSSTNGGTGTTSNTATVSVAAPPTVTSNSGSLAANAGSITIAGMGFDPVAGNNSVSFNDGAVGTVANATTTSLTVNFTTKPTTAGSLTAIVTTDSQNSGSAMQVATVIPVVTMMTTSVGINSTTVTINGFGFDTTANHNTITFNDGAVGTVTNATATSLTVTFSTDPTATGNLTAVVSTDSESSGAAVQIGTVVPTVQFAAGSETVQQSAGAFSIPVILTGAPTPVTSTFTSISGRPTGIAFDSAGNLYVSIYSANAVVKITPGGISSSFGSGYNQPCGLAFDSAGKLYVANSGNNTVSVVTAAGNASTFASGFNAPFSLAFDGAGNLYVSNFSGGTVSKVTSGGSVSTYASGFSSPAGLAFDSAGNLYVANQVSGGGVTKVTTGGSKSSFGSGFNYPFGLAFDAAGNLYVEDNDSSGNIFTVTPSGAASLLVAIGNNLSGLTFDASGNLYAANYGGQTVVKITSNVSVGFTLGGTAVSGTDYNGLPSSPLSIGIAQNASGHVYGSFTGTLPSDPGAAKTLSFTLGSPTNAVLGSQTTNTLTIVEPPLVTSSTASLAANAPSITITGAGFDATTPGNNLVTFNDGAVGTVTAATSTSLTVTFSTEPTTAGALTAVVTTDGQSSGTPVTVATVTPVVTSSTMNFNLNGTTLTINGFGFSTTTNTVTFSDGAIGTVTNATNTQLTVTLSHAPTHVGSITAIVTSNSVGSGAAVQVATVVPVPGVVTMSHAPGAQARASAATILAGVVDPDPNDTLTLVSVGTPAHGASRLAVGFVSYAATGGWTGGDSFTYTVQDSAGTQVSGTINVTVNSNSQLTMNITNITVGSGGVVGLSFNGIPSTTYGIQYTPTMSPATWTNFVDVTTDQFGAGQYTDTVHLGGSGFYRLIYPGF
jgi:sugar lactone lactonase YvrE